MFSRLARLQGASSEDAASCAPAALAALNLYLGRRHRDGTVSRPQEDAAPAKRPARSPLPVIWSGLVVVKLLRYRMTINDHAAARDSHRSDDRGDQSGNGTRTGFRASPLPPVCRARLTSPLSFHKRTGATSTFTSAKPITSS